MGGGKVRPSWDEYFMEVATVVARRSTCLRRQIGAILVKDKHILTTGYNGAPAGLAHCLDGVCPRDSVPSGERQELCRGLHAEQNALLQAARHGITVAGATLYCTTEPCSLCTKMLINAGIVRVVFSNEYPDDLAKEMLMAAAVDRVRLDNPAG